MIWKFEWMLRCSERQAAPKQALEVKIEVVHSAMESVF